LSGDRSTITDEELHAPLQMGLGGVARAWLVALVACALFAAFFSVVLWKSYVVCLVRALAVGTPAFWLAWALHRVQNLRRARWKRVAVGAGLGGTLGLAAARAWEARGPGEPLLPPEVVAPPLAGLILFGAIACYYLRVRAQVAEGRARLEEERTHRLGQQQQLTQAELKLLQAQIEPHFLFDTLSDVLQSVDARPDGAKRMLLNLASYLRASLQRTRAGATTLREELDLVRAYLEIQAERLGTRLAYRIDCPEDLGGLPLPPLLLQPLVENALSHGIEANPEGGEIQVRGAWAEDVLHLEVTDTGAGLAAESRPGVGLSNVQARVRAVSQGRGTMVVRLNLPHGLCVRVSLPLPRPPAVAAGTSPL